MVIINFYNILKNFKNYFKEFKKKSFVKDKRIGKFIILRFLNRLFTNLNLRKFFVRNAALYFSIKLSKSSSFVLSLRLFISLFHVWFAFFIFVSLIEPR